LKNISDEALIELYTKGNDKAFDTLLERYRESLFSYIYYILRNHESTKDFLQETLIRAIVTMRQGRYSEGGKFFSWLCSIAHNLIVDSFRQDKSGRTVSCDEPDINILNNEKLSEGNIENRIVARQIRADVRRIVSHLPAEQKEVVEMRYYNELSFKEIAERTGVSVNTSLGRMRYALKNIRRIADQNGIILTN
jgi:RNA polymerase sigma-70 factor (ECF subfamily)